MSLFKTPLFRSRRISPTKVESLEILRLDETNWRVSLGSTDQSDAVRILGFVERLAHERYEVLWLAPTIGWAYVRSLKIAIEAVADRDAFTGVVLAQRDVI